MPVNCAFRVMTCCSLLTSNTACTLWFWSTIRFSRKSSNLGVFKSELNNNFAVWCAMVKTSQIRTYCYPPDEDIYWQKLDVDHQIVEVKISLNEIKIKIKRTLHEPSFITILDKLSITTITKFLIYISVSLTRTYSKLIIIHLSFCSSLLILFMSRLIL